MKCEYCDKELSNRGTLKSHEKSCKIIQSLNIDKLRKMYYEEDITILEIAELYKIDSKRISKLIIIKGKKRKRGKMMSYHTTSYICQYCEREIKGKGNLEQHEKGCVSNKKEFCKKYINIKEEIIDLYVNENKTVRFLRKKYKLQSSTIKEILGDKVRSLSEASKLAHKLYPEKYKHSDETKAKLRKARLEYMKNNPDKTAWRLSNMSYPEKIFQQKLEELGLDKEHLIIREYSMFPYFIDFAFINEKVAIEIDGSQHLLEDRKERDDKKDQLLIDDGWSVFRVEARQVTQKLDEVMTEVVNLLKENKSNSVTRCGIEVYKREEYMKKERLDNGLTEDQQKQHIKQRKVVRPPYDLLLEEISDLGYVGTGKKYNVSDNAIRKWVKFYEKG